MYSVSTLFGFGALMLIPKWLYYYYASRTWLLRAHFPRESSLCLQWSARFGLPYHIAATYTDIYGYILQTPRSSSPAREQKKVLFDREQRARPLRRAVRAFDFLCVRAHVRLLARVCVFVCALGRCDDDSTLSIRNYNSVHCNVQCTNRTQSNPAPYMCSVSVVRSQTELFESCAGILYTVSIYRVISIQVSHAAVQ